MAEALTCSTTEKFEGPGFVPGSVDVSDGSARKSGAEMLQQQKRVKEGVSSSSSTTTPLARAKEIIAAGQEDAFIVCDLSVVRAQAARWRRELPRVRPFYAVKCNPDREIVRALSLEGCGFDVASKAEYELVRDYAVNLTSMEEEVIYANPCKQPSHVRAILSEGGVHMTTFDNVEELRKVHKIAPHTRFVLRILGDDSASVCRFNAKFGASVEHDVAPLLREAAAIGAAVVGVSFHVGSGCHSPVPFAKAVEAARRAFDMFPACGLPAPTLLDLGGGWPGFLPGMCEKGFAAFEDIAAAVRVALDECFPESSGVTVIAEPGRYFAHSSQTLFACVNSRRAVYPEMPDLAAAESTIDGGSAAEGAGSGNDASDAEDNALQAAKIRRVTTPALAALPKGYRFYLNDGLYGTLNACIYDHRENVEPSCFLDPAGNVKRCSGPLVECSMWGPTCDGIDRIGSCPLPGSDVDIGDWFCFEWAGAYTNAAAGNFNGIPASRSFYINGA